MDRYHRTIRRTCRKTSRPRRRRHLIRRSCRCRRQAIVTSSNHPRQAVQNRSKCHDEVALLLLTAQRRPPIRRRELPPAGDGSTSAGILSQKEVVAMHVIIGAPELRKFVAARAAGAPVATLKALQAAAERSNNQARARVEPPRGVVVDFDSARAKIASSWDCATD